MFHIEGRFNVLLKLFLSPTLILYSTEASRYHTLQVQFSDFFFKLATLFFNLATFFQFGELIFNLAQRLLYYGYALQKLCKRVSLLRA